MTYQEKLALAAEMRRGTKLDTGLSVPDEHSVTALKESVYLPGGLEKSVVPDKPTGIGEDLSHMNPKRSGPGGHPPKGKRK